MTKKSSFMSLSEESKTIGCKFCMADKSEVPLPSGWAENCSRYRRNELRYRLKECLLGLMQKLGWYRRLLRLVPCYRRGKSFFYPKILLLKQRKENVMKTQLEKIRQAAKEALESFETKEQIEEARIKYLGKR